MKLQPTWGDSHINGDVMFYDAKGPGVLSSAVMVEVLNPLQRNPSTLLRNGLGCNLCPSSI